MVGALVPDGVGIRGSSMGLIDKLRGLEGCWSGSWYLPTVLDMVAMLLDATGS